jgi:hypothetical protein
MTPDLPGTSLRGGLLHGNDGFRLPDKKGTLLAFRHCFPHLAGVRLYGITSTWDFHPSLSPDPNKLISGGFPHGRTEPRHWQAVGVVPGSKVRPFHSLGSLFRRRVGGLLADHGPGLIGGYVRHADDHHRRRIRPAAQPVRPCRLRSRGVGAAGQRSRDGLHHLHRQASRRFLHVRRTRHGLQDHPHALREGHLPGAGAGLRPGRDAARLLLFSAGYAPSRLPRHAQAGHEELDRRAEAQGMGGLPGLHGKPHPQTAHGLRRGGGDLVRCAGQPRQVRAGAFP